MIHSHPTFRLGAARQVVLTTVLLGLTSACSDGGDPTKDGTEPNIYTVSRGDMLITVQELGEVRALEETRVRSGVEGRATIIFLVAEGKQVEQGEKLVELDASDLDDRAANQAITVERAKAALVDAEQSVDILEKDVQALAATAKSRLAIAEIALEKYLGRRPKTATSAILDDSLESVDAAVPGVSEAAIAASSDRSDQADGRNHEMVVALDRLVHDTEYTRLPTTVIELIGNANLDRDLGEMANQVLDQIDQIRLARADLKLKEDTLEHSKRLAAKDYLTRNELDRHQLDYDSQESRVGLAWNQLDLLVHYGLRSEKIGLELEVDNAVLELSKVQASAKARRAREAAELRSREAEFELAKGRLDNLQEQIDNAIIYAPTPGLVVYAKIGDGRRSSEVVEEGIEVRQRQPLIVLPDVSTMIAELKVSEADIDKVLVGQRATLKIDAFPGRDFPGRVTRVSPLPDSGSRWSNNNKKVYKTVVQIDGLNELLRPGMSSTVTIEVGSLRNVLSVPLQAVQRDRAVHYAWLRNAGGDPVAKVVKPGAVNLTHVVVESGLEAGAQVYLSLPPASETPEFDQPKSATDPEQLPGRRDADQREPGGGGSRMRPDTSDDESDASSGGTRRGRGKNGTGRPRSIR